MDNLSIMKTEDELDRAILSITMEIKEKHPELSKYISEMPVTIPNKQNPKMNCKALQEYLDSLNDVLKNYLENNINQR